MPNWYNSVSDKINLKKFCRYLPTENDCACEVVYIPENRHMADFSICWIMTCRAQETDEMAFPTKRYSMLSSLSPARASDISPICETTLTMTTSSHTSAVSISSGHYALWTDDRILKKLNNGEMKGIMASLVRKLYDLGVVDASFILGMILRLSWQTPRKTIKSFAKSKLSPDNHPKSALDCNRVISSKIASEVIVE